MMIWRRLARRIAGKHATFAVREKSSSGICLDDAGDEIAWLDWLRFEAASDQCPEMRVFRHNPICVRSDGAVRELVIVLVGGDGPEVKRWSDIEHVFPIGGRQSQQIVHGGPARLS